MILDGDHNVVMIFLIQGTKEMPIGTKHTFIEALIFMPGGKDFYQKFVRQAKPVLFKETFKGSILNATTHDTMNNLEKMLNKELFNFDKKKMPFAHWYNKSRTEKIDIDLRANGSTILEEIYLPIMLQCREYKLDYEQFQISIFSRKAAGNLKQIDQEMLLFSFENGIKIELYDSLYSSKLLGNQMQIVEGLKSGIATLMKGWYGFFALVQTLDTTGILNSRTQLAFVTQGLNLAITSIQV